MADKVNDDINGDDAFLNSLIRASQTEPQKGFARPSGDTVTAYLLGNATLAQKKAIRKAFLESPSFRREMLEIIRKSRALDDSAIQAAAEKDGKNIFVPDIKTLQNEYYKRHPDGQWSLRDGLKNFLRPKYYIPVLAAAMIALFVLIRGPLLFPPTVPVTDLAVWSSVEQGIDPGYLILSTPRGPLQDQMEHYYPTAKEAALADFRYLLKEENGEFTFNPVYEKTKFEGPTGEIRFQVYNPDGIMKKDIKVRIPITGTDTTEISAWAIALPSKNLFEYKISSEMTRIIWTKDMGDWGCITFTYRDALGYKSILGYKFSII